MTNRLNLNGDRLANIVESGVLTTRLFYTLVWKRDAIDYTELARKRWVDQWTMERLAAHFGCGRTAIIRYLGQIRKSPHLVGDGELSLRVFRRKYKFIGIS